MQRDRAWAIHKYPCIGQWRFLELSLGSHKLYPEILARMQTGEQLFLDLGCAFAQDIRRLVADGVDSSRCYGSDMRLDFIELGYDLFQDKDTLKSKFIDGDIFDESSELKEIEGKVDIIYASSFFHLFNLDEQKKVALRVARLMRTQSGSLLVGKQVGNETAQVRTGLLSSSQRYSHSIDTWRQLWNDVGIEIGARFEVNGESVPITESFARFGDMILHFSVRRLG